MPVEEPCKLSKRHDVILIQFLIVDFIRRKLILVFMDIVTLQLAYSIFFLLGQLGSIFQIISQTYLKKRKRVRLLL